MGCSIGWGGVVFEEAGDADVEVWKGEDLLLPVFEGVSFPDVYRRVGRGIESNTPDSQKKTVGSKLYGLSPEPPWRVIVSPVM